MNIYVIRHAEAQQLGQKNDFSDEKRSLTSEGRDRMRDGAKGLRALGVEPDMVMTSPHARALETAEIVAAALGISKKEIVQTDNLKPGASVDELFAEIKRHTGVESLALVGHEPDLSGIISRILHGHSRVPIEMKKGSVCCLNVTETVPALHGNMVWLMTVKHLRMVGKS